MVPPEASSKRRRLLEDVSVSALARSRLCEVLVGVTMLVPVEALADELRDDCNDFDAS